jgi:DNA-binding response OmpR family regulator
MSDRVPGDALPLALLADGREERTRWLARLLEEAGYGVLRERTAQHALQRARAAQPDLIVIGGDLPESRESSCAACCAAMSTSRTSQPIFLALPEPVSREGRLAALRERAWECEPAELLMRTSAAVRTGRAEVGGWIRRFEQ